MKDCEQMRIELPGFASGKLEPGTSGSVRAHVASCPSCRTEVGQLERLDKLLAQALPSIAPSRTFASTFANRLAAEVALQEEATRGGWLGWVSQPWVIPAASAAMLLAVVAGTLKFKQQDGVPALPLLPLASDRVVASAKKEPAAESQVAKAAPAEKPQQLAKGSDPDELKHRADLFVDFAVIRDLDIIESENQAG